MSGQNFRVVFQKLCFKTTQAITFTGKWSHIKLAVTFHDQLDGGKSDVCIVLIAEDTFLVKDMNYQQLVRLRLIKDSNKNVEDIKKKFYSGYMMHTVTSFLSFPNEKLTIEVTFEDPCPLQILQLSDKTGLKKNCNYPVVNSLLRMLNVDPYLKQMLLNIPSNGYRYGFVSSLLDVFGMLESRNDNLQTFLETHNFPKLSDGDFIDEILQALISSNAGLAKSPKHLLISLWPQEGSTIESLLEDRLDAFSGTGSYVGSDSFSERRQMRSDIPDVVYIKICNKAGCWFGTDLTVSDFTQDAGLFASDEYELKAVVSHRGQVRNDGDYTTYTTSPDSSEKWLSFNDESVTECDTNEAVWANYGFYDDYTGIQVKTNNTAAFLMYVRKRKMSYTPMTLSAITTQSCGETPFNIQFPSPSTHQLRESCSYHSWEDISSSSRHLEQSLVDIKFPHLSDDGWLSLTSNPSDNLPVEMDESVLGASDPSSGSSFELMDDNYSMDDGIYEASDLSPSAGKPDMKLIKLSASFAHLRSTPTQWCQPLREDPDVTMEQSTGFSSILAHMSQICDSSDDQWLIPNQTTKCHS